MCKGNAYIYCTVILSAGAIVEGDEDDAAEHELPQGTQDIRKGLRKLRELATRIRFSGPDRFRWVDLQEKMMVQHDNLCIPEDLTDEVDVEKDPEGEPDNVEEGEKQQEEAGGSQVNEQSLILSRGTSIASNATPSPSPHPSSPRKKEPLCLPRIIPTRWSSTCFFLERACNLREVIDTFARDPRFYSLQVTNSEWMQLKKLKGFLKLGKSIMLQ